MDIKLTTLCLLWFCLIANLSVSQVSFRVFSLLYSMTNASFRAPRPNSTQGKGFDVKMMKVSGFERCLDLPLACASVRLGFACPEETKACKNDEKTCATYCDGKTECTDASDEFDCGE